MPLPQLPADKSSHAIYGGAVSVAGVLFAVHFGLPPGVTAIGFAAGVGVLKEVWDRASESGTPDPWDAVATAAGGIPAALAAWVAA